MKIPTVSDLLYDVHHDRERMIERAKVRRHLIIAVVVAVVTLVLSAVLRIAYGS